MPQVAVAVAAAAAGGAAGAAVSGVVATAVVGALAATAVTVAGSAILLKKPKPPQLQQEAQGVLSLVRSSVEPHKIVYGTRRLSGTIVFMETTGTTQYTDTETDEVKTFRGDNAAFHMVIALAGHEVEDIGDIVIDDETITLDGNGEVVESKFHTGTAPAIRVKKHLGTADQAADPDLVAEVGKWTENHRLRGVAYIAVRLIFDRNVWPNGIPNISAIVKGAKVYDPRTDTTAFSNNWALCVRDYLTNSTYGLGAGVEEIDDSSIIAAANISDEDVNLKEGGTQPRYTCDGVVDTGKKPIDVIQEMTTAAAGVVTYAGGQFKVFAAAYNAPVATIDHSWLRGELELKDRPSQKDVFNTARGIYVEPEKLYQPTDLPEVKNSTYVSEDNGRVIAEDFEFPFTTDVEAGQRLLKLYLETARRAKTIQMACNQKAMQLQVNDTVRVTSDLLGFDEKVFRVIGWQLEGEGGVDLSLKEEEANVYAFNPTDDITLLAQAPSTNLPDARLVAAPGSPSITEDLIQTTGAGGLKPRVKVSWQASTDVFAVLYTVEYRKNGDTDFVVAGQTRESTLTIHDMQPAVYTFRVRATNSNGVESAYTSAEAEVQGLTAPPADITGFTLNAIGGSAHLSWDQVPDLDVKAGGRIKLRFTTDASPAWAKGHDISDALPGVATSHVVPLLKGTYMAKAVDSSGNDSRGMAKINASFTSLLRMNVVADFTDDASNEFAGDKTNMFFDPGDNALKITPGLLFDDVQGLFDDQSGLFDAVGAGENNTSGSYKHSETFDLGHVGTFLVTADLQTIVFDEFEKFDSTEGLFDSRTGEFDGEDISTISTAFYIRTTNDDPAGTPTWTQWRRFIAGEHTARAAQFKFNFTSKNQAHNIRVDGFTFHVDMPDIQQRGRVTTSSSADVPVSFDQTFAIVPEVGFGFSGAATGDFVDFTNLGQTGFDVSVRDQNANRVVRELSWIAVGY